MADVRALLKAKREEKRVSHPFAAYSQTGQLRCTACSTFVKHASAWNGHLGSKSHRTNAARLKEDERSKEAKEDEKIVLGKRKVVDEDDSLADEAPKKPRLNSDGHQSTALPDTPATGLPPGFFSDPSHSAAVGEVDSDEEEEAGDGNSPPILTTPPPQSSLDLEWTKFQEAVINAPADADARETFERATIFAEPQLSTEIPEGFPSSLAPEPKVEHDHETTARQKDDGGEQRKREEEEKELIMDRLLDEERAQEEADERVNALKARLDLLRQKRMASKKTRPKS